LLLDDRPLSGPPEGVVTVFQDYGNALLPWRTVRRNVALPLEGRVPRAELRARVDKVLDVVGLAGRDSAYLKALSGGMQQRVQIARALMLEPQVLLMDEPFGALDALTKAALQDTLLQLHERTGVTVIFITHDLEEAIYLSDSVYVIAGQPGTLSEHVSVSLPRPRDQIRTRESAEFLALRHKLAESIDLVAAG
jgi:NitT/TauT family transport system ATP-binding protein